MSLDLLYVNELKLINNYLDKQFPEKAELITGLKELRESVRYSLLSGGKRFRPLLSVLTAKAFRRAAETVLPYGAAVELVHTYSLIHDDLPCMDDDDERRGQPTNHKVYGEAMAVLTGDGLLTDAFRLIADNYKNHSDRGLEAVSILSRGAGLAGMVGGQAIDIKIEEAKQTADLESLKTLHNLKTGALIAAAVEGAAVLCEATNEQRIHLKIYGENLGLAFQLADDLLDKDGFFDVLGEAKTKEYLAEVTNLTIKSLSDFGQGADPLRQIAKFNQGRLS